MGSGGARPGAGRPRKSLEQHRLEGTRPSWTAITTRRKPEGFDPVQLLLHGPWACGITLATMPDHDELVRLWGRHARKVGSEARRLGVTPWFLSRREFVDLIRD